MVRLDKSSLVLATGLSVLAGYVDAIGLRIVLDSSIFGDWGTGVAQGLQIAVLIVALLGVFIIGVVGGSLASRLAARQPRLAVLAIVALLLAAAAGLNAAQLSLGAVIAVALAVGASNSVFQSEGNIPVGLLFLTATLVGLGEGISAAITGGNRTAWTTYLLLFLTTAIGALLGWSALLQLGPSALWVAAGAAAALAVLSTIIGRKEPPISTPSRPTA
jgi:uncharacterized membrane protein YoaK (UPF0700 family)